MKRYRKHLVRRALAALLASLMLAPCALAAHRCESFEDVRDDWSRPGICAVAERGLMQGTSATTFAPDESATRAMLVMVLYRLEPREKAPDAGFPDVAPGMWYTEACRAASAASGQTAVVAALSR